MKRICIFCGSSTGTNTNYEIQATLLGKYLAQQNIELVYGGANVGLMGAIAHGVLDNGGKVIGVLPIFLKSKEIAHNNLTKLIEVKTMHERKAKMFELSDAFVALPGGFGTIEETFEMLTWAQLGLHQKPIALLNLNGFYDGLINFIQNIANNGLLKPENKDMLLICNNIEELFEKINHYNPKKVTKWI
ncbi:Rossman fold protein, TIGR00730 family [Flavobacterium branchiophilum NBRC 15030 = ATCC 35035]|nr:TIGR00730 family Rossman fold protein [Flavobacterium branchiophilum]OXA72645.1 Rossman fold protein, TIGR00730 family [Flavobacterium branchiophilum NBRC 15030 = ATCC 35035]